MCLSKLYIIKKENVGILNVDRTSRSIRSSTSFASSTNTSTSLTSWLFSPSRDDNRHIFDVISAVKLPNCCSNSTRRSAIFIHLLTLLLNAKSVAELSVDRRVIIYLLQLYSSKVAYMGLKTFAKPV